MAREGLFNILNNTFDFEGIRALDLFSGSGSITWELLSRDAEFVDCIEKEKASADFIRATAALFRVDDRIRIHRTDAFAFLQKTDGMYNFIFADPPYAHPKLATLPAVIMDKGCLAADGLFILEHDSRNAFAHTPFFVRTAQYGDSYFSFFSPTPPATL
jgi:16S rRNA (guanine(966)-N(2))-methyltransferase RsmD